MFREKFIARVPEKIVEAANFPLRSWQRTFNAACWVRFQHALPHEVSLVLHFTDDEGKKAAAIDRCRCDKSNNILLSGHFTLAGKGKVKEMGLYLAVSDSEVSYVIDELYIQSCEAGAAPQAKIIHAA